MVSKFAFFISLGIAVELDPRHLFFLELIVPVMVRFFVVYGLFSRWIYATTGLPLARRNGGSRGLCLGDWRGVSAGFRIGREFIVAECGTVCGTAALFFVEGVVHS